MNEEQYGEYLAGLDRRKRKPKPLVQPTEPEPDKKRRKNKKTPLALFDKKVKTENLKRNRKLASKKGMRYTIISRGSQRIEAFLLKNKIIYKKEKVFDDLKHVNKLRFDFYLPEHNMCIEYNGKQHYEEKEYFDGDVYLKKQIHLDKLKREWCIANDVTLLVIPYTHTTAIEDILNDILGR
jgi:very-short-patch-repair endonuclease